MILISDTDTAFVLIPKNASNSLREALSEHSRLSINGVDHISVQEAVDAGFVKSTTKFIGIIRNPLERQLSLYLYRHRQGRYNGKISVSDFRSRMSKGVLDDHPWQTRTQSSYMKLDGKNIGSWWLYEDIDKNFAPYGKLSTLNKSMPNAETSTRNLVSIFYDISTIDAVYKYWEDDFLIYERLARETRQGSY